MMELKVEGFHWKSSFIELKLCCPTGNVTVATRCSIFSSIRQNDNIQSGLLVVLQLVGLVCSTVCPMLWSKYFSRWVASELENWNRARLTSPPVLA